MPQPEARTDLTTRMATPRELAAREDEWWALAGHAIEPNAFYAPNVLLAAARFLPEGRGMRFVIAERDGELVGLAPLLRRTPWRFAPLPGTACLFWSPLFASVMPLLDRHEPAAIWRAMLGQLRAVGIGTLIYPQLPMTHAGGAAILAAFDTARGLAPLAHAEFAREERPAIESALTPDDYLAFYSSSRRKTLANRGRRLSQQGEAVFDVAMSGDALRDAMERFLALEASGWKKETGTAFAMRPDTLGFARALLERADARIHIETLLLDGRAIASNLNLVSQGVLYAFKNAYDEGFSRLAPGVLLDHRTLRRTLEGVYRRVDSCAGPRHRLMDEWLEREEVAALVSATAPDVPPWRVGLAASAASGLRALRDRLKALLKRG